MVQMTLHYEGQLHCALTHGPSGKSIETDAPKDNNGKGDAFSPTDLVSAGLGACMMTVMGIAANKHAIRLEGARIDVIKEMIADPDRRIGQITLKFTMPKGIPLDKRSMLENAAHTCPVQKSLHPNVKTSTQFIYPD